MSGWRPALAALALLGAVPCCAVQPPAPVDPRVVLTPDAGVIAEAPVIQSRPLLRASVRLVNPAATDRPVIGTTDWMNAAGMPVRSLLSAPRRLTVPRAGSALIQVVAPNPAAVQFRIRIEPDNTVN